MTNTQYIHQLSTYLFWDIDMTQLDVQAHARYIIQRVLEYGNLHDWQLTYAFYGLPRIVDECKQMRSLDPKALTFICAITDTQITDYRCYHFRQSYPTLWNS